MLNNLHQNIIVTPNRKLNDFCDHSRIVYLIVQIKNIDLRENSIRELSKIRENYPDLAVYLWYSTGTITYLYFNLKYLYFFTHLLISLIQITRNFK